MEIFVDSCVDSRVDSCDDSCSDFLQGFARGVAGGGLNQWKRGSVCRIKFKINAIFFSWHSCLFHRIRFELHFFSKEVS